MPRHNDYIIKNIGTNQLQSLIAPLIARKHNE